jgi:hypothetical protein
MIDFDTRRKPQEILISINEEMRKIKLHIATKEMLAEEEAVKLNNRIDRLSEDLNTIEKIARERNISLDHEENYLRKSTYRSPTKNYYDKITNSIADFSIINEDCDEVNSHSITKIAGIAVKKESMLENSNKQSINKTPLGIRKVGNLWNKFKNPRSVLSK